MEPTTEVMGINDEEVAERETRIRDILDRGKVVRFTNTITGVTKDVSEWNLDEQEDLTAFRTSPGAKTAFVGWKALEYEISELDGPTPDD